MPPEAGSDLLSKAAQSLLPNRLVLAFDTSAAHCAAALLSGGQVRALCAEPMAKGQAERLMPMIADMLARQGVGFRDLSCVCVGTGPGNFTGIRISVALARGLALGLGVRAVGVTGFEAVSHAGGLAGPHWVVIDAPRGQVYAQRFGFGDAAMIVDAGTVFDAPVLRGGDLSPGQIAQAVAEVGWHKAQTPQPRPAPFYLRGADAAPPTDPAPVILP